MSVNETLLELQEADTAIDQLRYRLAHLPELVTAVAARDELVAWERDRSAMRERLRELDGEIEGEERASEEIDRQRTRLEAQLRTVIAPREAEAIQSELATLAARRGELDERELVALEEQSEIDDRLRAHLVLEESLRTTVPAADEVLGVVQRDAERELADLEARRLELRAQLDERSLARYDGLRAHHGVAVVRFQGHRCDGCHMDLSPAEMDVVKATPDGGLAECPQCGRLLLR